MKKLFFSVCAAALLLLPACSRDDENFSEQNVPELTPEGTSASIIGTWESIQTEWTYKKGEQEISLVVKGKSSDTFKSDNTVIERGYDENNQAYEYTFNWRIEGNTLIIYTNGVYRLCAIEKLTKDELILSYSESAEDGLSYYVRALFQRK